MVIPEGSNPHSCGALITSSDSELELKCGCFVPVLNACRKRMNSQHSSIMPVVTAYIGGKPVQVFRDTGCYTVLVRRSLVIDKQLRGESQLCVLIDGSARKALCARIYVDTPFYTGSVRAICMENLLYDLIIGNISGVNTTCTLSDKETIKVNPIVDIPNSHEPAESIEVVQTRAQAQKDKVSMKPLKVAKADENISKDKLLEEQQKKKIVSLEKFWTFSTTGEVITGRHSVVLYLSAYCCQR